MKLNIKYIRYVLVLFPVILIFISEIISFRNQPLGSIIKLLSVVYMFAFSLLKAKFDAKLVAALLLFLPFLVYHMFISFNFNAAIEEAIRYLFPLITLLYSYAIRNDYKMILSFIVVFALVNNLYQPISYVNWLNNVKEQWFYLQVRDLDIYYYNATMGIMRGVGLIGFFATYGFLNLIAFFIVKQFYNGKYRKALLIIFTLGLISSLSFKALGVFLVLLFILSKYKDRLLMGFGVLFLLVILLFPKKVQKVSEELIVRIEVYVTEGDSARAESYRVMLSDILDFNILGRGVGSFGGAASTKYDSPVYEQVDFNWYKTIYLATTDTYYPHLFVELGIIGGFLYLLIILSPLLKRKYDKKVFLLLFVIYFALFFDSIFSFAMNNLSYLMLSLLLVYPVLEYQKRLMRHREMTTN